MIDADNEDRKLLNWTIETLVATVVDESKTPRLRREALGELERRNSIEVDVTARQLLDNSDTPIELRSRAAVALRHRIDPKNEQVLIRALGSKEGNIVRFSAASLGRVGGRKALDALRKAEVSESTVIQRSVSFARSLISYRLGLPGERLVRPDTNSIVNLDPDSAIPLKLVDVQKNAFTKEASDLTRELPGFTLSPNESVQMECLGQKLWVVYPSEILKDGVQRVSQGNIVAAAVLKLSACSERWYVHEYVLMHQASGITEAFGVRPSGRIVHFGECSPKNNDMTIRLRAVNLAGLPAVELTAEYYGDRGAVTIREALTTYVKPNDAGNALVVAPH